MGEIIGGGILLLLAVLAFVLSLRSFCGRGLLLNNAYLYASRQEREAMDKGPYYRQSAVVFLLLGCSFALNGLAVLLRSPWLGYGAMAGIAAVIVYAIASTVAIGRRNRPR